MFLRNLIAFIQIQTNRIPSVSHWTRMLHWHIGNARRSPLYIPCVHHESSPLLPAIQWTNSMQRMLACFIQIDFLKLVYKRIIKFWFKLHLKIRPFSQKFLHLFEQVFRLSFILTTHCLHELVMPCYIDYSDANKLLISWTVKWLFFVYVQSLCKISKNSAP